MNRDLDEEILNMTNKLQWALGESLFRAKKLKALLDQHPKIKDSVKVSILAYINALTEFTDRYRHDVADCIKDQIKE